MALLLDVCCCSHAAAPSPTLRLQWQGFQHKYSIERGISCCDGGSVLWNVAHLDVMKWLSWLV